MKNALKLIVLAAFFLPACSKSTSESDRVLDSLRTAHQKLYNSTMDLHDEVMPKRDNILTMQRSLRDSLAKNPSLSAEAKSKIEAKIQFLDSADHAMMVWMREFNPPDSVASPEYRIYMEKELEKVKQVKAVTLEALKL